ncbi:cell wall-binding repeat-containing protein [Finegoldia magna]|uniref:cell wall-binding repeat-containing protein n=1 Tax=Finegoldia magna TaxID=1260 RepID=UPI0027BA2A92|nr:cell wall-binding repeat-containing protein [Finegoldia magna]
MKKFLGVILTASMVMSSFTPVLAEEQNKIKVDRIAGVDRYETSAKISKRTFPNHIKTVVLASGENFADSLVAGSLANKENAPVLLTQKEKLPQAIKDEVDRLNPEQIIIVGGEKSVNVKGLKNVKRLAGADRYETSVEVYKYLNPNGKVALASGLTFADALCATPLSSKENLPIILTDGHDLPKGITKGKVSLIFGGEKSVNIKGLENTRRLAGADRYETALIIAKEYGNLEKFVLADGRNYPDALSVAPLAHKNNEPILLTDPSYTEFIKQIVKDNNTKEITVVGGELSVSSKQTEEIASVEITEDNKLDTPSVTPTPTPDNPSKPDKPDDKPGEQNPEEKPGEDKPEEKPEEKPGEEKPEEKPEDIAKEKALKEAKEKAVEELKENGIISEKYIDQINKAKTVEGVNALKEEIIKAHKKSEEEKPEENPDDIAKEKALKEAKEKAIEELKNNGITSPVYIDQINKAKTVEGVNALKDEIIKSHKNSEEKPEYVDIEDAKLLKVLNKNLDVNRPDDKLITKQEIESLKEVSIFLDKKTNKPIFTEESKDTYSILGKAQDLSKTPDFKFSVTRGMKSLKGIEYATNLEKLKVNENEISDLTPLKDLKNLKYLELQRNRIVDLSPLSNLKKLEFLKLYNNIIENVEPLKDLTNLTGLDLHNNVKVRKESGKRINYDGITDISSLKNLSKLTFFDVSANRIENVDIILGMEKINHLDFSDNKIKDYSKLANYILPRYKKLEEGEGSIGFHGQNVEQIQSVTVDNNKVSFVPEYKGLGNLFNEFAKAFEMEDVSEILNVTTNVEGVTATFDVKNGKINLEVTDEFLKANDGKTVSANLKIVFAEAYAWNLNDVKLQVKKPEETTTPETPVSEGVHMIRLISEKNITEKATDVDVRIMGDLKGVEPGKFIVKLVDSNNNEIYPEIVVDDTRDSTSRKVTIKVPENKEPEERQLKVYATSTGKKDKFVESDVVIIQQAGKEETPTPETPEEEKIAMIQEITTSNLPAKDAIAKIRVGGQINNIPSDKFIVKLVDEDGKETYPEIEVTGEVSKAVRVINIKFPENTTDKEKTYEIFASSTGKKENFKKADFTLTQEKSSGTPEVEKTYKINYSNKDIVITVNGEEKTQAKKGDTVVVKAKSGKEITMFYVSGSNEEGYPMKVNFKQVGDSYQFTMPESDCTLNIETKDKEVLKENIQMLKLTTPKKVSKDSSTATVEVMGILSGIANDKFVVKLVDNDGNGSFPKVNVSGDVNKTKRTVSFEIPKNTTTKEKEYTVYVSSTGSKTDFASATVKITQEKSDTEEQIPEGIKALELETPGISEKLDAAGGKVVLKVMGNIKNVSDDKFVVKLVDDKGNETFPQITVSGNGARRTLEFEAPKNEEATEKTYKIYATSTGSHTKFYEKSVEIKQNASENTKSTIEKINVLTPILKNAEKLKANIIGENVNPDNLTVSFYRFESGKFVKDTSIRPTFENSGKFVQIVADSIALIKGNEEDVYKILVRDNTDISKSYEAYFRVKYTEDKAVYTQIMPSYVHAAKDGKIIEVGFDEEIEEIFNESVKLGTSIDKNADGNYERLTNGDTVELSDKKFVITLEKPLDVERLGTQKAKIKINQGVFRSKGTENLNSDVDYFINIGKPIVRQATIEGNDVITNKNRKVTIKVNGLNLSENAKVKAVMQTKLAIEDTAVARKGKQPEVQGTISGTDNEQTITFELPENKTDRTVSYEILYKPEMNGNFEKLPGNNPKSRANATVVSLLADGVDENAATLAFMKIQTYGATSTEAGKIPDITYGVTPTIQESKKTFTHVYGTNLEAKKTRVRIFDERGVEWYIVNQPSLGAAAFKMVVPALIGIDGDGNYQTMEIIGPGSLIGDHTFTYKVAVDGKNYDDDVVVRANILASGKTDAGKFDLENQETTLKLNYVDVDGNTIQNSVEKKSYSFFQECAAGIYPDSIENYKPIKIVRKSDGKEIQLTDGVDYTDYRNLQLLLGVNKIGENPEYTIVYEKTK